MKLTTNPENPRTISKDSYEKLKRSIERNPDGLTANKIAHKDGIIISGNQRYRALQELGLEMKPEWFKDLSGWTDEQITEWVIQSNISAGEWDWDILANEWDAEQLEEWGVDIDKAWTTTELPDSIDDIPQAPKKPVSKLGDLWLLGEHRVLCGDSTDKVTVEILMEGKKADMLFTDPPYGVDYEGGHFHSGDVNIKRKREKLSGDTTTDLYAPMVEIACEFVDGPCYTFFAGTKSLALIQALDTQAEIHAMLIWHKTNATYAAMNSQYKQRHEPFLYWKPKGCTLRWTGASTENTLWELKKDGKNDFHPTQKPVELVVKAINNHSAKTVLDLFLGSGSTLIACEQTDRTCYGLELDPQYVDVICKRWQTLTGNLPVLESTGEAHDFIGVQ